MPTQEELIRLAGDIAISSKLDPTLVKAVVEQESSWEPWSIRYEPLFYARYVVPLNLTPTEAQARSFSWGLLQIMGQSAREIGFHDHLASLCDPATGLLWGCKLLKAKLARASGDVHKALLYWNGGSNVLYPDQVIARMEKYK